MQEIVLEGINGGKVGPSHVHLVFPVSLYLYYFLQILRILTVSLRSVAFHIVSVEMCGTNSSIQRKSRILHDLRSRFLTQETQNSKLFYPVLMGLRGLMIICSSLFGYIPLLVKSFCLLFTGLWTPKRNKELILSKLQKSPQKRTVNRTKHCQLFSVCCTRRGKTKKKQKTGISRFTVLKLPT